MTEEMIRLLFNVSGQEDIAALREQFAYTEASVAQLSAAWNRGELSLEEYTKTGSRLATDLARQKDLIQGVESATRADAQAAGDAMRARIDAYARAERAAKHAADAEKQAAGDAMRARIDAYARAERATEKWAQSAAKANREVASAGNNAANKLQMIGQTLDDLQYVPEMGLRPILNNIMQISPVAGIALLAIDQLVKGIGKFVGQNKEAEGSVGALKKQVEELEKKPHKIALDLDDLEGAKERLDKIEGRLKAFEAATETKVSGDLKKQISEAVTTYAGGSQGLADALMRHDAETGMKRGSFATRQAVEEAQRRVDNPDRDSRTGQAVGVDAAKATLAQAKGKLREEIEAAVKDVVGGFLTGDAGSIATSSRRHGGPRGPSPPSVPGE